MLVAFLLGVVVGIGVLYVYDMLTPCDGECGDPDCH